VNGPGAAQTRDLSRSMSNDNWREAKSSLADDDHRGAAAATAGGGGSRGWGNSMLNTSYFSFFCLDLLPYYIVLCEHSKFRIESNSY